MSKQKMIFKVISIVLAWAVFCLDCAWAADTLAPNSTFKSESQQITPVAQPAKAPDVEQAVPFARANMAAYERLERPSRLAARNACLAIVVLITLVIFAGITSFQFVAIPILSRLFGLAIVNAIQIPLAVSCIALPASVLVNSTANIFYPASKFLKDSKYYSISPKIMPAEEEWPSVTIQIPVYTENFEDVIEPTLRAAMKATQHYITQGGWANIVVNEDGLLKLAQDDLAGAERRIAAKNNNNEPLAPEEEEIWRRLEFYRANKIGFVARPTQNRAGLFKKASNMNFSMALADAVALKMQEGLTYEEAMREVLQQRGPPTVAEGDIRIGEFIVLLDKDSLIPEESIVSTIPEFIQEPQLGFTQHKTRPTNADENYFSRMIGRFTVNLFQLIFPLAAQGGDTPPFVGHNAFLRKKAMVELAIEGEGTVKYWSEERVSEDFDLSLRMQSNGFFGRYVAYPNMDFGEGVTRTYDEEVKKLYKFAFGATELLFNPIRDWLKKGILTKPAKQFLRTSSVPWYAKFNLTMYFLTYFAIGSVFFMFPMQMILTAIGMPWGVVAASSLLIMMQTIVVFTVVSSISMFVMRFKMRAIPEFRSEFGTLSQEAKADALFAILYFAFYAGVPFSVFKGVASHLLTIPITWGVTSMDRLERREPLQVGQEIIRTHCVQFLIATGALIFIVWAYIFWNPWPFWHIFAGILLLALGHLFGPFLYNPIFMEALLPSSPPRQGPPTITVGTETGTTINQNPAGPDGPGRYSPFQRLIGAML